MEAQRRERREIEESEARKTETRRRANELHKKCVRRCKNEECIGPSGVKCGDVMREGEQVAVTRLRMSENNMAQHEKETSSESKKYRTVNSKHLNIEHKKKRKVRNVFKRRIMHINKLINERGQ